VLQALRSHDERFHAKINQIELNKQPPDGLAVDDGTPLPETERPHDERSNEDRAAEQRQQSEQLMLGFDLGEFRDAMYARIVKKVGERTYWEKWANDIAGIAQAHITRIRGLLADPDSNPAKEFEAFLGGLRGNLNENITADEAIEMLAQHLITRPIFEALFAGYDFAAQNPVARTMELMLVSLDEHNLEAEQTHLDRFYASVRRRVDGVSSAEGKQRVIVELYDNFFATAFKKTVDRLGIVYTPVEIVDFILTSADEVMRAEFGRGLTDEGVHILDGFTGTGTFLVRLLQSGLITPHDLARKYAFELHANEILLLAYYIAAVNIETTYAALSASADEAGAVGSPVVEKERSDVSKPSPTYTPFPGLVLTNTFQSYEDGDRDDLDIFPANNERIERQRQLPITVIVGNPPYSVGQDSANDDAANLKYPGIDTAIRDTYAARSTATNKNSLYDSYIRAIKWASLRLGDQGVIGYVTNGGWLDANVADGMRQSLAEEFSAIYVFNLRGNQRTAGEQSRREGGKVFGGGSRATVAITILVKKPSAASVEPVEGATIHYTDIGDYLSTDDKLAKIAADASVGGLDEVRHIAPNEHGDWLHQRADDFEKFLPLGTKGDGRSVFGAFSGGLKTNRDAWAYGATRAQASASMQRLIKTYDRERAAFAADPSHRRTQDPTAISWNRSLVKDYERNRAHPFRDDALRQAAYRPFTRHAVYFNRGLNDMIYRLPIMFPTPKHGNLGFYQVGAGSAVPFSVLMLSALPDLHVTGAGSGGQFFSRWTWEPVSSTDSADDQPALDLSSEIATGSTTDDEQDVVVDGYRRIDNITQTALSRWRTAYGDEWSKDDVFYYCYGLLHSPDYRETYAADLKKMLPRIPLVATAKDARAFTDAGRALADLHVDYESVEPYPLQGLDAAPGEATEPSADRDEAAYRFYAVGAKKMRFGTPTAEQKAARERHDRSTIHYNDRITLSGIPGEAYRYQLGSRSAIEWILDRYYIRTDKASGIVNDPNDWSREVGDPRYILDLLARIVTVSLETMRIIDTLPPLMVRQEQR